jgi:hypothetical protein
VLQAVISLPFSFYTQVSSRDNKSDLNGLNLSSLKFLLRILQIVEGVMFFFFAVSLKGQSHEKVGGMRAFV